MGHTHPDIDRQKWEKGFTLIELMVALAVSSIVLLVVGQFFINTNKTNTIQEKVAGSQQSIRAAMEMMTRDIRMAGLDPSGDAGNAGFVDSITATINGTDRTFTTGSDSIVIRYDYDGDGECNDNMETVIYSLESDTENIMCYWSNNGGSSWQSEPLTENGNIDPANSSFTYDPSTSDIQTVTIVIEGNISGAYKEDSINSLRFSNTIKPRNLYSGPQK